MVERYRGMVESDGGTVHRSEDWGRRQLAYPIQRLHKAHYYLMNVECNTTPLEAILEAFRFNDAVLRHMVIKLKNAVTEESPLIKKDDKDNKKPVEKRAEIKVVAPVATATTATATTTATTTATAGEEE
jgi:small subunit ribosomal protein S6